MALPLWQPLRDAISTAVSDTRDRAVTAFVTLGLVVLALGFGVAAGLAALVPVMGFAGAALVFAAVFAAMALGGFIWQGVPAPPVGPNRSRTPGSAPWPTSPS
jgi:hypothetical protein